MTTYEVIHVTMIAMVMLVEQACTSARKPKANIKKLTLSGSTHDMIIYRLHPSATSSVWDYSI